jgi:O-antigen/teichoic acid export membrane protein
MRLVPAEQPPLDILRTSKAGALMIRGGAIRTVGYAVTVMLGAATSVFLLRGLGVNEFGRYATVAALLGIVSTLSDVGSTAIGTRELSLRPTGPEREALIQDLVAIRVLLASAAVVLALAFATLAGYDRTLIAGVLVGGIGVLLVNTQAIMMVPLSVDLRVGTITVIEIAKSAITLLAIAALAVAGASLLPYFTVQILAGLGALALTPKLVGSFAQLRPRLRRSEAKTLMREAIPIGVALAMNVLYLRLLVVMVSLTTSKTETGLYGTAFRIVELFIGIPPIVIGVALPLLVVAGSEDLDRLRYGTERLLQVAVVASMGLALIVTILAEPTIRLLGGAQYVGATHFLQTQIWALVPLAAGNVIVITLLSLRRQRDIALSNGLALVVVLTAGIGLISVYGGEGAAVAGVAAESALLLASIAFLTIAERSVFPSLRFVWRPLVALAAGFATMLVPLPPGIDGVVAAIVFGVVAFAVGAIPHELLEALRQRGPAHES